MHVAIFARTSVSRTNHALNVAIIAECVIDKTTPLVQVQILCECLLCEGGHGTAAADWKPAQGTAICQVGQGGHVSSCHGTVGRHTRCSMHQVYSNESIVKSLLLLLCRCA